MHLKKPLALWAVTKLFTWTTFVILTFRIDVPSRDAQGFFLTLGKKLAIWDSGHYDHIVRMGYDEPWRMAFFPLYPFLVRILSGWTGNIEWAGILLSNLCLVAGVVLLYNLLSENYGSKVATTSLLLFLTAPTSVFFITMYTESLFFLLSVLTFILLVRHRWFGSALAILACSITRNTGLLLVVLFLYAYGRWMAGRPISRRADLLKGLGYLIVMSLGWLGYMALAHHLHGDALAFFHGQERWGNHLTFCFHTLLRNLIPLPGYFCREIVPFGERMGMHFFILALISLGYGLSKRRAIPTLDLLYFLMMVLFFSTLLIPTSLARYLSVVFPFWVFTALMLEGSRYRKWLVPCTVIGLLIWQTYMNGRWAKELWVN
jgi:hypothetical protein